MSKMMSGMLFGLGIAVVVSGATFRSATADPTEAKPGAVRPTRIAVIDMARVFKSSRIFKTKSDAMTRRFLESAESTKSRQAAIEQMKTELDSLDKGADERADLAVEIKLKLAEFEIYRKDETARLRKQESEMFREVYEVVSAKVAAYSRAHGIDLVIRFQSEPITDLESMNRQVVYENGLDITDDIIVALK